MEMEPVRGCKMIVSPDMKVGLYTITYLGLWYRGEALPLERLIARAREYGYDGIEIDGKRPHVNPLDWPRERCRELRALAAGQGIEIYAVAANNDFTSPIPEHREAQIAYVRDLIRMAADLGASLVRVFAAWPGVTVENGIGQYAAARKIWAETRQGLSRDRLWSWCREALAECARYAVDAGVTLALQNHPPVIDTHQDMLRMIREVDSRALKACLDAPLIAKYEARTPMRDAVLATGALQALSHFGGEYQYDTRGEIAGSVRTPTGALEPEEFYAEFISALAEIGYRGYIGYELCHPLPVVYGQTVGIDFADRNARLAAEYMRALIRGVSAHSSTA
jgi:sugar phosphate isomerase/epimerase